MARRAQGHTRSSGDAAGEVAVAPLVEFQKNLDAARDTPPTGLSTAKLCLDQLAQSAAEIVRHFEAAPESQASWWARALAGQCSGALDELTLLTPRLSLTNDGELAALDQI